MKLGLIQYSPEWENPEANKQKIDALLTQHLSDEDILIFPEMTLTGFTMKAKEFAEDIDGDSVQYFMELARKHKKDVFAGIIEEFEDKIYNSLYHIDKNGLIIARYRKIHPYSFTSEDEHYDAGNEPVVTKFNKVRIGLSICYDLRFPELYRKYTKEGIDVLIDIANWPVPRSEHWKTLLKARAIENQCFMIGVNRVGTDPALTYNGCSGVFDPMGNEIAMNEGEETLISVNINPEEVAKTRSDLPFLKDMKMI